MKNNYESVIGLEVHAQLLTKSKAFCSCSTEFGTIPNANVCPICLGLPGVLPVLNKQVVEFTIRMGLATNCSITEKSIFARKNYFYPDLPKGYQISQYEEPICQNGFINIEFENGETKKIGITRIHMEEDAGKSIHDLNIDTLVDVNRCGVPLIEIVSEPEMRSPKEAYLYLNTIKQILTYLNICDGNMEEGSLRCDANISVRKIGETKLGTKTELKNMNSFRNVERALEYEINRQINLIEDGGKVKQESLLWDANKNVAVSMRSKEEAHDYRYFPEPDLVPIIVDEKWKNEARESLPEMPWVRLERIINQYNLPKYDAEILTNEKPLADFAEEAFQYSKDYKSISNLLMTEVLRVVKEKQIKIDSFPISPKNISLLVELVSNKTLSSTMAKEVFNEMLSVNESPNEIVKRKGLTQVSDTGELEKIILEIISKNPEQVEKYKNGKTSVIGFFVGEVMKSTKGRANPQIVNELLKNNLSL
ncbi:MAG: Asp-tRNA(Asn)/Glu-tRNA(Gln) amidotransferase subunit GatB [Bacteroidota bacterium]